MKFILPLFILLVACDFSEASKDDINDTNKDILGSDTQNSTDQNQQQTESGEFVNNKLKALLENPLDLPKYKGEYGPSNSSVIREGNYFDIPDTVGFLYRYFFFYKLKHQLPSQPSEVELFDKFIITVYMYGEDVGRFSDNNEELMMIECALDNPTLEELNWYGQRRSELVLKYDSAQYVRGDSWIYNYNNRVIIAHFNSQNQVDWFKYARLNPTINLEKEIPDFLLNF